MSGPRVYLHFPLQNADLDEGYPETLTVSNVTHLNEGWYTCVAGNSLGVSFASAYLKVVDGKRGKLECVSRTI